MHEQRRVPSEANAPSRAENCRVWACDQLGIAADASAEDIMQAFWLRVQQESLVPSPAIVAAFEWLMGGAATPLPDDDRLPEAFRREETLALSNEVETLAREILQIPPQVRQQRWQGLFERCRSEPRLIWRLKALAPAIHLRPPNDGSLDPADRQLLLDLQETLVAPFSERAERRRHVRQSGDGPLAERSARAGRLKKRWPQLAAMAPTLMAELCRPPRWHHRVRNWRERPNTPPAQEKQGWERWLFGIRLYAMLLAAVVFFIMPIVSSVVSQQESDYSDSSPRWTNDREAQQILEQRRSQSSPFGDQPYHLTPRQEELTQQYFERIFSQPQETAVELSEDPALEPAETTKSEKPSEPKSKPSAPAP